MTRRIPGSATPSGGGPEIVKHGMLESLVHFWIERSLTLKFVSC